jgi:putative protease
MEEKQVGEVFDYFSKVGVAAIKTNGEIKVGDKIHIKGHTTDLEFTVESMQVNNEVVESVSSGGDVGIKVPDRVRKHDLVFLSG